MKKIYPLLIALIFSLNIFAQFNSEHRVLEEKLINYVVSNDISNDIISNSAVSSFTPFWSSDFSNPSDWVIDNTGSFGNEGWSIDPTTDSWYLQSFTSTSGGNFAELGNGDPTVTGWSGPIQVEYTITTANPIDVYGTIGSSNATLSFEEYGARFNDLQAVQVSIDGTNFVTVADNLNYPVTSQSNGSNPYPNPSLREISLAPYIGSMPTQVWIRFSWTTNFPSQATNPNVWITYGWCIDDVSLTETAPYVMEVVDQNHGGWDIGYLSTNGVGMDYTYKPQIQSDANPYMFEMTLANLGAQPLHGIRMNIDVNSGGMNVFSSSSDTTTLSIMDTASYLANQTFAPLSTGQYDMSFYGSSNNVPMSDVTTMTAYITDTIYGRDNNNAGGAWRVGRNCGGLQLANKFDVYATDEITSISAHVADYSIPGAFMYGILYEVDTTGGTSTYIPLAQTDDYTIQSTDRDNWVTIGFTQAYNATPGMYMVAIGGYMHPLDTFGISVSGDAEPTMSMIYDDGSGCDLGTQTAPFWYWVSNTPMIRMNLGYEVPSSINSNIINNIKMSPNPSKGNIFVEFNNMESDSYKLVVTDVLGKEVFNEEIYIHSYLSKNIDLTSFSRGTYLLKVSSLNSSITKKIILE